VGRVKIAKPSFDHHQCFICCSGLPLDCTNCGALAPLLSNHFNWRPLSCRGVNPERVPGYWVKTGNRLRGPRFFIFHTRPRTRVKPVIRARWFFFFFFLKKITFLGFFLVLNLLWWILMEETCSGYASVCVSGVSVEILWLKEQVL